MTPQETILTMLIEHPSLFNNKLDCLNHLFNVVGNGYQWVNGELLEVIGKDKYQREFVHENDVTPDILQMSNDMTCILTLPKLSFDEFIKEFKTINENAFNILLEKVYNNDLEKYRQSYEKKPPIKLTLEQKLGGMCKYSKVIKYPDNITEEWETVRKEWETYLKEHGFWNENE